ncbi:hypothetical protein RND81_03G136800 [Saponaria officinalis]|uniref:PLAT domain-containing protein n=1 Tax=Saponaria officinalis TaxID=3572 RepID=A0AAW1M766_SAPOF
MDVKLLILWVTLFCASFLASNVYSWDNYDCTYVIYIKTGDTQTAGTHAKVSLELKDIYLNKVNVTNLSTHGVMGKWYEYFQSGNTDAFAIKAKCLKGPVCSITLSHDNSGFAPGWYVDSVDVTVISPRLGCRKTNFPIGGWLASDEAPFNTRYGVYLCDEIVHFGSKCSDEN